MENKYFKSLEDLRIDTSRDLEEQSAGDKSFILKMQRESAALPPTSRRDFLKAFGFTIASAAVASSCEQPVRKAIPFLIQPEGIIPGKASWYASTFFDGTDYCSVLVKVRDGRPIKIEGNNLSSITKGGTNARTQASVLNLYDNARLKNPSKSGSEISWETADAEIGGKLKEISARQGKMVLLTPTIISPSTAAVITDFVTAFPSCEHIQYDVLSAAGMLRANQDSFGAPFIPSYHFEKADLIVSFDADFLGSWLSPVEYTKQYSQKRKLTDGQRSMSRHIHFEGAMSLTGSNADHRVQMRAGHQKFVLVNLLSALKKLNGESSPEVQGTNHDVQELAAELFRNKGKSLVVSGSNSKDEQLLVNEINMLLGNYGHTIDTDVRLRSRFGFDSRLATLVEEMNSGAVKALIMMDVNPLYDYPQAAAFSEGLKKVELSVALSVVSDETAAAATYICPDHHYLEAWNDFEYKTGFYSLSQPAIRPIFNTRAAQESLLQWSGNPKEYRAYVNTYWEQNIYPKAAGFTSFTSFWNSKLHDGVFESGEKSAVAVAYTPVAAMEAIARIAATKPEDSIDLVLYANVSVGTGKHANNPWLQELPDPVTKVCWDNYLMISPRLAEEMNVVDEQLVNVNGKLTLPVVVQPGQEYKTVAVALGYGRQQTGVPANGVGQNAYTLMTFDGDNRSYLLSGVSLAVEAGNYPLARTQSHHSMEGRELIRETSLEAYLQDPQSGNEARVELKKHMKTMYPEAKFDGLHWGMAIDLNACTGCNACVVACSSENNVPVVGKEQVIASREMHWIRIDRYYKGDEHNPEVVRQPVMCQHCDNAPCENVCPVAATTHSNEGINQMAYNRCIGTRYCANNCPYKVRRFNFLDYTGADTFKGNEYDPAEMTTDLRRLVLNPDVTVRAKGVIEKCSFCVQRIQEKKLVAKTENRELRDGEVVPACAQSCAAEAIVFGNLNDKNSKVSQYFASERNYHLLEEIHTLPSVGYLTKVKNKTV